ncbi:hypothetical protein ACIBD9_18275 [Micromonospora sp. NPDC050784]|uniref:hypothetical protein n=1 Tax=Micromonospora sp. NPDC050784 TaxID=3364281 RepID=UPI00378F0843
MTTTQTTPSGQPQATSSKRRWPIWLFRLTSTIATVLAFDQAVFAGQFLSGSYGALHLHRDTATYTVAAIAASIVTATLWRLAGAGPRWPLPASIVLLILTALQTWLGYQLILAVHIPLGVTVIVLLLALTAAAWRKIR